MRQDIAFSQVFLEAIVNPAGGWPILIMSALPFAGAFSLTKQIGKDQGTRWSVSVLVILIAVLAAVYLDAYLAYQDALRDRQWTGASLVVGVLFLKGFAVILIAVGIREWQKSLRRSG